MRGTRAYAAIDGGAGAHLLADLAGRDPYLQPVTSSRHADLLIIVEPVSNKLLPSLLAVAKSLPHPTRVLLFDASQLNIDSFSKLDVAKLTDIFPEARRVSSLEQLLSAAFDTHRDKHTSIHIAREADKEQELETIQMPQKSEQEMATELAVLSLGPIQPFTAGPLRLFLICDGEQVLKVQVEAGYAHRGIDAAMQQATWSQALPLSRHFDPLAPIAGQLAYVQAVEQLQKWHPSQTMAIYREIAIALERVHNTLWWCVRIARILADEPMLSRSYALAHALTTLSTSLWQRLPYEWLAPQYEEAVLVEKAYTTTLQAWQAWLVDMEKLHTYAARNPLLALRTRGIGILDAAHLHDSGITSGPVLDASESGIAGNKGDVQSRLVTRLQAAQHDLQDSMEMLKTLQRLAPSAHEANWMVLPGEAHATVRGPRGDIGLHLVSEGGNGPSHVMWQRPSAALLPLLPEILIDQKLADAELIVASLDLSMAEVDG